jgi:hypothetical protein
VNNRPYIPRGQEDPGEKHLNLNTLRINEKTGKKNRKQQPAKAT